MASRSVMHRRQTRQSAAVNQNGNAHTSETKASENEGASVPVANKERWYPEDGDVPVNSPLSSSQSQAPNCEDSMRPSKANDAVPTSQENASQGVEQGKHVTDVPAKPAESFSKPKRLKYQPKAALRRTKDERVAMELQEAQRQATRQRIESVKSTGSAYRGQGRGRGGMSNVSQWKKGRELAEWQASGVMGGETTREKPPRVRRGGGNVGGSSQRVSSPNSKEGEQATPPKKRGGKVKKESGADGAMEKDDDGDVVMSLNRSRRKNANAKSSIKWEDEQPEFPVENVRWDDEEGPKLEIAQISLISDDESLNNDDTAKDKRREKTPLPDGFQLRPVRLERHEHVEPQFGINTDASSLTSAELRRRAKSRNEVEGSLFLPEEDTAQVIGSTKKAGRKPRDVEIVRHERKWKGVYEDAENDEYVFIKSEPPEDDVAMSEVIAGGNDDVMEIDNEQATRGAAPTAPPDGPAAIGRDDDIPTRDMRRPKAPGYLNPQPPQSCLTEEEDEDLAKMVSIFKELQQDQHQSEMEITTSSPSPTLDHDLADLKGNTRREGRVFLLQLPPILPTLRDASKMPKPLKPEKGYPLPDPAFHHGIKPDPDTKSATSSLPPPTNNVLSSLQAGCPGSFMIYETGHMRASWGGLDLEIEATRPAGCAQEVLVHGFDRVVTKVEDQAEDRGKWEDVITCGDSAWSMGSVEGGFTAGLDWGGLLG